MTNLCGLTPLSNHRENMWLQSTYLHLVKPCNTLIEHASHVAHASLTFPPLLAARSGSFLFLYIVSELENKTLQ